MGPVRTEVMWQSVLDAVEAASTSADGLDVLDLGGGTGGDAVRLARLGHRVTVVDPSPDALASLDRRAAEADLDPPGSVTGILGDTADLAEHIEPASFDLVVCHGVLEHVDDPGQALAATAAALRPGGHVSVVVAGRLGAVLARALAGDFAEAQVAVRVRCRRPGTCAPRVRDDSWSTRSPRCSPRTASRRCRRTRCASSPIWCPARWSTSSPARATGCSRSSGW